VGGYDLANGNVHCFGRPTLFLPAILRVYNCTHICRDAKPEDKKEAEADRSGEEEGR